MEHKQIELENEIDQILDKLGFATRKKACFYLKKLIILVIKKPDALITDEYNGLEYKAVPNKYYDQLARLANVTMMSVKKGLWHMFQMLQSLIYLIVCLQFPLIFII